MGVEVRVGLYQNEPEMFSNCYRNPQLSRIAGCPYPGWCIEIISMIIQYLNATLVPINMHDLNGSVDWGTLTDNDTWTGALGTIERGEVDTVCLMFQPTQLRSQYFDFSTSVVSSRPVLVVREPIEEFSDYVGKVFKTFQTQLWAMFLFVISIQSVVMIACYWLEAEVMGLNVFRPFNTTWQIFRFFIVQPYGRYRRRTYGGNTLMCVCSIATLLFTSLYQGLLLTRLLDPVPQVPFATSDQMMDMIASNKFSLITNYKNNWFFDELSHSNWSYFERLREATKNNPVTYVDSVDEALDRVESGGFIYPTQEDANTLFKAKKRCSLVYIDNSIPALFVSFAFRKNSSVLKEWNRAMVQTQTFQVKTFDKYMRDGGFMANEQRCFRDPSKLDKLGSGLSAFDLMGAFLLILTGFALGSVFLIGELLARRKSKTS